MIDSNSTSAVAGDALVEIKRSGVIASYNKTVTLKLSNSTTSLSGNNPVALEIESNVVGINFKAPISSGAVQMNLENSPYGGQTGINMGISM